MMIWLLSLLIIIVRVINHLLEFNASQVSCKPGNKATVKCAGALVSL